MSFYEYLEDNDFWTFDKPMLDLMKEKKYRDLWDKNKLNSMELIRDFLLDFGLIKDWTEYIKMRLELAEVEQ